jgi:2-methylfumaryl-CoA hydratase
VRFSRPVYPGDTLRAETEVIGLRETSDGAAGVVYVTTRGLNQKEHEVLRLSRWVLVPKRKRGASARAARVPSLPPAVPVTELAPAPELNLERFSDLAWACGGCALWDDYEIGERIDHGAGMTIEEADHVFATRLYQNPARVHFDQHHMAASRFGRRLVYGGHVISVAHALAHNGLENALCIAAWNSGVHAHPTFAGDTIYAYSEVLAREALPGRGDLGALRVRLVAVKNADPSVEEIAVDVEGEGGKRGYDERVVLDLDLWLLMPRRPAA